jgi:hypothetical protein
MLKSATFNSCREKHCYKEPARYNRGMTSVSAILSRLYYTFFRLRQLARNTQRSFTSRCEPVRLNCDGRFTITTINVSTEVLFGTAIVRLLHLQYRITGLIFIFHSFSDIILRKLLGMSIDVNVYIDIGSGHVNIESFHRFRKVLIAPASK